MTQLVLPKHVLGLKCILCDALTKDPMQWVCSTCGPESRMDVVYADDAPRRCRELVEGRPFDMFRYRELLPLQGDARPLPISVGGTPLSGAPRLAKHLGVARVWLKDEGRNPSASLKDRPSAVGVIMAVSAGAERIACASTGNAASSTACAAASVGLPATIFVPKRAPAPKVAQLRIFGADVFRVDADYDRTWELCAEVVETQRWFNRNCAVNPYLVEGKKTAALEVAEQLGSEMCDWLVYSVGDGCTIAGGVKGLEQAHAAGWIPTVPRVLGVQADGAKPLVDAFNEDRDLVIEDATTIADSICVAHPRNWRKALASTKRNNGAWVAVTDDEILEAAVSTARLGGVFGEPAAAAATAGVLVARREGIIKADETVGIIVSGNGLKDTATAQRAVSGPVDVEAGVEAVLSALRVG